MLRICIFFLNPIWNAVILTLKEVVLEGTDVLEHADPAQ